MSTSKHEPRCRLCGHAFYIVKRYLLRFSTEDWPLTMIFFGVVMCIGDLLTLAGLDIAVFGLLSCIPILFRFETYYHCERCDADVPQIVPETDPT